MDGTVWCVHPCLAAGLSNPIGHRGHSAASRWTGRRGVDQQVVALYHTMCLEGGR